MTPQTSSIRPRRTRLEDIVIGPLEDTMRKWPKAAREEVDRLVEVATTFRKERDVALVTIERQKAWISELENCGTVAQSNEMTRLQEENARFRSALEPFRALAEALR